MFQIVSNFYYIVYNARDCLQVPSQLFETHLNIGCWCSQYSIWDSCRFANTTDCIFNIYPVPYSRTTYYIIDN